MVVELFSPYEKLSTIYDIIEDTSNIAQNFSRLRYDVDYHLKVSVVVNGRNISLCSTNLIKIENINHT